MKQANVIDITDMLAINKIGDLLELSKDEAESFFTLLKSGKTLAEALREIGIRSASEIGLDRWPKLRKWRDTYFPDNVKIK
jgi:hypothetical protein